MTDPEKIARFGFDPGAGLKFVGTTKNSYSYLHPDGNTYSGKFDFYYNVATGAIDVCHSGCNGTRFRGHEKDGAIVFNVPFGYPPAEIFVGEFTAVRDAFLTR